MFYSFKVKLTVYDVSNQDTRRTGALMLKLFVVENYIKSWEKYPLKQN